MRAQARFSGRTTLPLPGAPAEHLPGQLPCRPRQTGHEAVKHLRRSVRRRWLSAKDLVEVVKLSTGALAWVLPEGLEPATSAGATEIATFQRDTQRNGTRCRRVGMRVGSFRGVIDNGEINTASGSDEARVGPERGRTVDQSQGCQPSGRNYVCHWRRRSSGRSPMLSLVANGKTIITLRCHRKTVERQVVYRVRSATNPLDR